MPAANVVGRGVRKSGSARLGPTRESSSLESSLSNLPAMSRRHGVCNACLPGSCSPQAVNHLSDDGVFVLECRVPSAHARPGRQFVDAERIDVDQVVLDVCSYDPITQILDENHVRIGADGIGFSPIRLRLAHPPEFDLMARIAGLRLRERLGRRTPSSRPAGATSASTSERKLDRTTTGSHVQRRRQADRPERSVASLMSGSAGSAPTLSMSGADRGR